jgi:hypothetical protein
MRKLSLFGITIIMILAGAAAWTNSSHSAVKPAPAQIDPLSMMAKAKNLPSQESLNAKMWPNNAIVRY